MIGIAALPLVAAAGFGVKWATGSFEKMPATFREVPAAQTSYVYAADGKTLLTTFYEEHRIYTPLSEISPYVQEAVVAAEDSRFFEHHGVDPRGILRALVANRRSGEVAQGASTLTMQYIRASLRNSAETPKEAIDATAQTPLRKLREIRLATSLEQRMSKTEILEAYLNVAYFGHRAYGIRAAAQVFFSKLPRDLTLAESATLAGLVKAPTAFDPASNDQKAALDRRNWVIDRMVNLRYISRPDASSAQSAPIQLRLYAPPTDCVSIPKANNDMGFFCDMFRMWWMRQPAFGSTPAERFDKLRRGGWTVVTSIDPAVQAIAQREVLAKESVNSTFANGLVVVQPGTGLVKAMAVNRIYSMDQSGNGRPYQGEGRGNYPNTVNMLLGGGDLPGYQAGSTFKMFTMLAALEKGLPLNTVIFSPGRIQTIYPGDGCGGYWCPVNASGAMTGNQTFWSGFGKSVNTFFVQLEERIGVVNAVRMAERLGLTWRTEVDKEQAGPKVNTWGSFTLGVADTSPLEMATAYAAVAASGLYCEYLPVVSITDPDGNPAMWTPPGAATPVQVTAPRCKQVVSQDAARGAADAARCTTGYNAAAGSCGGWSTAPGVYGAVKRPVAGKTGTTDSTRAAWFVGFTPDLAAASFIADPDNPMHVVGDGNSNKPIDAVSNTLRDALAGSPVQNFIPPSRKVISGH